MAQHDSVHPRARTDGLMIEPLGDELLIYDTAANRAHSLNSTAAAILSACTGARTRDEIAAHCRVDPLAVALALDRLADAKLIDAHTPPVRRVSRRTALRRMALTGAGLGVALPVIRSIVAPSAAMAGSTANSSCSSQSDCTGTSSTCFADGHCHPSTCYRDTARSGTCAEQLCCYSQVCSSFTPSARMPSVVIFTCNPPA